MLAIRIFPDQDLKEEIQHLQDKTDLKAGIIICAVGSLKKAVLRMSNGQIKSFNGPLEVVSVQGTVSPEGIHVHLAVSDENGHVWGGHLKHGCKVHTTVELSILKYQGIVKRQVDPKTGFKELIVD
jgi:uncharacterized protein